MLDLVIIGAGPAGITAAIYAARKKIDFVLVSEDLGGQTALSADVENYTGYQFITGPDLAAKFEEHLRQFAITFYNGEAVTRIAWQAEGAGGGFAVESAKASYACRSVLIASGRRPRWLGVPGEEKFRNKGVSYCATCDGPLFSKKTVAVIGGGNSALDAALQMVNIAEKVYLVDINAALGGDEIMRRKVQVSPRVEVLNNAKTVEIAGDRFVTSLKVEVSGKPRELAVSGIFVEIGSIPNSEIADFVDRNDAGEIVVDCLNRTSVRGVFAAGDVTTVPEKQIIVAAGEGAKAVLGVSRYLMQEK
ncbi:thioredoxin reductase [Candidatus Velamenicoccus archaeovorus]|uniref:Thioredoxin reductase n=1 Tax=Velamenicoccus archaeovorus TaxID=1930593 RepID=A0A410P2A6_VELA1|nr:FAD-dependent oxidoreductase [Candidatus Velamenicoccus archaeovorus]QAT16325.1 thioredoxin reductase [Candidatus Velamenicoccus archaeovorus]